MTEAEKRIRAAVGVLDPAVLEAARKELDSAFIDCTLHAQVAIHVGRYLRSCSPENIAALLAEIDRLTRERNMLKIGIDSVLHALARADVADVDDPGDAIDLLAADAKRYGHILDCEFIAARKYLPNLDEHEFKAKRIAHHDAQIEQERGERREEDTK